MSFRWSRCRNDQRRTQTRPQTRSQTCSQTCSQTHTTRNVSRSALWLLLAASACTVARVPSTPSPQPSEPVPTHPVTPQPTVSAQPTRGGGPWAYAPASGTYSYVITTDATIERVDSAAPSRTLPTTTQRVTLAIFSTGDVQLVDPPAPVSGVPCDAAAALRFAAPFRFTVRVAFAERPIAGLTMCGFPILSPRFVCSACRNRGADVRPNFD